MKTPFMSFAALGALLVAGCGGGGTPAENSAAQLDNAAAQSTLEAAAILNNTAEQMRAGNVSADAGQAAMQAAGNAQAANTQAARSEAGSQGGAKPHRPGDPVPPPKLAPGQAMPGNSGTQDHGPR